MYRRAYFQIGIVAAMLPLGGVMGYAVAQERQVPGPKRQIELPTKAVLANRTAPAAAAEPGFANPKVQPGKVRWHVSFAAAQAAAQKSGKPVLLFHMMGKLDDQFC